jgi:ankyrin repeat protein
MHAMEKETPIKKEILEVSLITSTTPNIAITPPNQPTPPSTEKKLHSNFLRRSQKSIPTNTNSTQPSTTATQSASSEESPQASPKAKGKKFALALSNLSGSKENSPRNTFSSLLDSDPDKNHPLLHAVKENNPHKVTMLLNINTPDEDGNTPFIIAARNGSFDIICLLLAQPTLHPNMQNIRLMTALHCAAKGGHKKIVKKLVLDPRIDSSITENSNFTVLNYLDMHKKCHKLKDQLFGRITLDTFVNKEISGIHQLIINNMLAIPLSDNDFDLAIKTVKKNITNIANDQNKDRQLPIEAIIPTYATDKFIRTMMEWRLVYNNAITMPPVNQSLLLQQSLTNNNEQSKETSSIYL